MYVLMRRLPVPDKFFAHALVMWSIILGGLSVHRNCIRVSRLLALSRACWRRARPNCNVGQTVYNTYSPRAHSPRPFTPLFLSHTYATSGSLEDLIKAPLNCYQNPFLQAIKIQSGWMKFPKSDSDGAVCNARCVLSEEFYPNPSRHNSWCLQRGGWAITSKERARKQTQISLQRPVPSEWGTAHSSARCSRISQARKKVAQPEWPLWKLLHFLFRLSWMRSSCVLYYNIILFNCK
jgi:hypothetical protein